MNAFNTLTFNAITTEISMEWRKTLRQMAFTLPALLFPLMFYLFFGVVFSKSTDQAAYMMVTYGVFGIIGPALFSFGVGLAVERGQGWFALKQASPMPASAMILARTSVAIGFAAVIVLCLFAIGHFLGGVTLPSSAWVNLFVVLLLGAIPFCFVGLCFGLFLPANSAAAIVNLIYLPTAFLSGLWIPIFLLPEAIATIAQVLAPYHLAQLALDAAQVMPSESFKTHVIFMLGFTLLMFLITVSLYNKKRN